MKKYQSGHYCVHCGKGRATVRVSYRGQKLFVFMHLACQKRLGLLGGELAPVGGVP